MGNSFYEEGIGYILILLCCTLCWWTFLSIRMQRRRMWFLTHFVEVE